MQVNFESMQTCLHTHVAHVVSELKAFVFMQARAQFMPSEIAPPAVTATVNGHNVAVCTDRAVARFWRARTSLQDGDAAPHFSATPACLGTIGCQIQAISAAQGFATAWLPRTLYYSKMHPLPDGMARQHETDCTLEPRKDEADAALASTAESDTDASATLHAPKPFQQRFKRSLAAMSGYAVLDDGQTVPDALHSDTSSARVVASQRALPEAMPLSDQARELLQRDVEAALLPFLNADRPQS